MRQIFLTLIGVCLCWVAGFAAFVSEIPSSRNESAVSADAIVVLTGGKGRLEAGLQLLVDGKAEILFVSGVASKSRLVDLLSTVPEKLRARVMALPPARIDLGRSAENTIGNADETKEWLARNHLKSVILVTANYHMPRALLEFSEVMPHISMTPFPVFPENFSLKEWWKEPDARERILSEYHKYLAAKSRHLFIRYAG